MEIGINDIVLILIIFQLLVFSVFLFLKKIKSGSNYILGVQFVSQAIGVFTGFVFNQYSYFKNIAPDLLYVGFPFMLLWGPTFYLYIKATVYKDFSFKKQLVHFIPFLIAFVLLLLIIFGVSPDKYLYPSPLFNRFSLYFNLFIRLQVLLYIIFSVRVFYSVREKLKENHSSISKTNFSWIRFLVSGFMIAYILTIPVLIFWNFLHESNIYIRLSNNLPYFIYFNIIFFKAWYQPEIFSGVEENVKYKYSKLTKPEAEKWIGELNNYMALNKPYFNPDLTLNQLAEDIKIHPRILSQVVNEYFNQNFYDYINKLRVEEAKILLRDNTSGKKTIMEIFFEVGFNSKSAFNIAFKKITGLTPTEFRKGKNEKPVAAE